MKPTVYLSYVLTCTSLTGTVSARPQPFSLVIEAPEQRVQSGSPIRIKLTLTNNSESEITLVDTNRSCDYTVDVRDGLGHLAPETEYKRESICSFRVMVGKRMIRALRPQESFADEFFANEFYDTRLPGVYFIQLAREISKSVGQGKVISNTITITVTR